MLKEIIKAFRHKNVISELSVQVGEMLEAGRWMFEQASDVLMRKAEWHATCDSLYTRDRQINEIEQGIRERIVTHLSVGNQADLGPCLALMNVVKDAERIGDYCKNIFEVGRFYRGSFSHRPFAEPLDDIRQKIISLFEPIRQAFIEVDSDKAERILQETNIVVKQCDLIVQQLLVLDDSFDASEAVAYALLARHYKRVEAHLSNIALSVISPVPFLDFPSRT